MFLRALFRLLPWLLLAGISIWLLRRCDRFLEEKREPEVRVTHHTILTQIEKLGKLELVRYRFKDIVEYSKELSRWLPNSKTVLIVSGEAVGCLDLTKIKPQDIVEAGDTVYVALPPPELCYFKVDHGKSKVYSLENTFFQDARLVDDAYRYAEANLKQTALRSGILKQTQRNAEKMLRPLLEGVSGKTVLLVPQGTQPVRVPQKQ